MKKLNFNSKTINLAKPIASKILQDTIDKLGFVPNMYSLMANNEALLDSYAYSYHSFRENAGFSSSEQEVIFLSAAFENECEYCMAAHSFVADNMSNLPVEVTNAIRNAKDIEDEKLKALSLFTRSVTKNRGKVADSEVQLFLDAGYTEEHILGVITGVGVKTFSNYFNHFASTPLDAMFSARKWEK